MHDRQAQCTLQAERPVAARAGIAGRLSARGRRSVQQHCGRLVLPLAGVQRACMRARDSVRHIAPLPSHSYRVLQRITGLVDKSVHLRGVDVQKFASVLDAFLDPVDLDEVRRQVRPDVALPQLLLAHLLPDGAPARCQLAILGGGLDVVKEGVAVFQLLRARLHRLLRLPDARQRAGRPRVAFDFTRPQDFLSPRSPWGERFRPGTFPRVFLASPIALLGFGFGSQAAPGIPPGIVKGGESFHAANRAPC